VIAFEAVQKVDAICVLERSSNGSSPEARVAPAVLGGRAQIKSSVTTVRLSPFSTASTQERTEYGITRLR
jgi:hypothetical protein